MTLHWLLKIALSHSFSLTQLLIHALTRSALFAGGGDEDDMIDCPPAKPVILQHRNNSHLEVSSCCGCCTCYCWHYYFCCGCFLCCYSSYRCFWCCCFCCCCWCFVLSSLLFVFLFVVFCHCFFAIVDVWFHFVVFVAGMAAGEKLKTKGVREIMEKRETCTNKGVKRLKNASFWAIKDFLLGDP